MALGHRKDRLAGTIRKHLAGELSREVKDPRLSALCIEDVEVTGDLGVANVSVRLMVGGDDPVARREAMAALRRIAPGLRASLGPVLRVRRLPELRFHYDEGADRRARIEEVLEEIHQEDAQRAHPTASNPPSAESPEGAPRDEPPE